MIKIAFRINGEQINYSVKSVDSWGNHLGKIINQSWIDTCLATRFEADQRLSIKDIEPQMAKGTLGPFP